MRVFWLAVVETDCAQADKGRGCMSHKIVILTEIIAPYRIPVFNALASRPEVDLHVIFLAETDPALRKWKIYTDEIRFSYEVLPSLRWRVGKKTLLLNRGVKRSLHAAKGSTILCGGYNYPASWQSLWWARRHGVRFVLWSESNQQDQRSGSAITERMKLYFVRHCDAFVVPGKSSFAYLQKLGVNPQAIYTAPNAVDNDFFSKQAEAIRREPSVFREALDLPQRYILYVGRLVPEKGVFDLLEAYAKLGNQLRSEVGIVFAGNGSSAAELAQRSKNIRPGTIHFAGFAEREKLASLYALADVLVMPTHTDPWGLVVNEAMACGLPVIVTSVAGCAADLVEDGWNGLVMPPKDPNKLAAAMSLLLEQFHVREKMAARSWTRIQSYSPEACADGLACAAMSNTPRAR